LNWDTVVAEPKPVEYVACAVEALGETIGDGATLSIARLTDRELQLTWLGDSSMRLFADGRDCWRTADHTVRSDDEVEAARRLGCRVSEDHWDLKVLTPTRATLVPMLQLHLGPKADGGAERVNVTRALGHRRKGGRTLRSDPSAHVVHLDPGRDYRLVMGTDGLWDVMCAEDDAWIARPGTTAELLCEKARERWAQEWVYRHPASTSTGASSPRDTRTTMPQGDDVAVVVWNGRG
jgi:serine/threonine protein phosphatase PrpC